jgi:hypothetical protein
MRVETETPLDKRTLRKCINAKERRKWRICRSFMSILVKV